MKIMLCIIQSIPTLVRLRKCVRLERLNICIVEPSLSPEIMSDRDSAV